MLTGPEVILVLKVAVCAVTLLLLAALFADPTSWCETTMAEAGSIEAVVWPEARRAVRA